MRNLIFPPFRPVPVPPVATADVAAAGRASGGGFGDSSRGRREADIPEFANIQVEVIVPPEVAQALLTRLAKEFSPRYGMIAFESDVRVLRPNKF